MNGFAAFRTRSLLTFVVPAIITFLSVYWFRKRRKLKASPSANDNNQTVMDEPLVIQLSATQVGNSKSHEDQTSIEVDEGLDISTPTDDVELNYNDNDQDDGLIKSDLNSYFYTNESKIPAKESIGGLQNNFENNSKNVENNSNSAHCNETNGCCDDNIGCCEDNIGCCDDNIGCCDDNCLLTLVDEIVTSPTTDKMLEISKESENNLTLEKELSCEKSSETCFEGISSTNGEVLESIVEDISNGNIENSFCPTDFLQTTTAEIATDVIEKKNSSSIESPINRNQDASSDCDAPSSSIGSSSISLSDLSSTSPVDSVKEQTPCHNDRLVDEDLSIVSRKNSTLNQDPSSSSSSSKESNEVHNVNSPRVNFRYSCRKNADVLCKEVLSFSEQQEETLNITINRDLECNSITHKKDMMNEVPNVASSFNSGMMYAPVIDSKTFQLNASNHYVYEFELPQELCGRLIGRQGNHVKYIKEQTNATVYIKRHPFNTLLKLAVVEGSRCDVNSAMELLHKKFPPAQYPNITLAQTNAAVSDLAVPESLQVVSSFMDDESNLINRRSLYFYYLLPSPSYIFNNWLQNFTDSLAANSFSQLHLPENTSVDVVLSSTVSAGHFFLQQPTHPTYPSLSVLDQYMMTCYSQTETPQLLQPPEAELVCAATIMGGWYRAQVNSVSENGEECEIRFVDYGGYLQVPTSSLRQIRSDFTTLPFQASECYLANVQPVNAELGWSSEASKTFEELAQGQILQAVVINFHENGVPNVYLYRVQGITSTFINQELVSRGFAKWIDQ